MRDFKEMGAEIAPESSPPTSEECFDVYPRNWPSVCAFLACQRQWRVTATMAGIFYLGLDYVAADVVLRRLKFPDAAFAGLQVMEEAALPILTAMHGEAR